MDCAQHGDVDNSACIFHDAQRLVEIYQHVFNNFADDTFTCALIKNVTLEKDPEKIPERPSFVQLRITLDPSSLCSSQEAREQRRWNRRSPDRKKNLDGKEGEEQARGAER